MPNDENVSLKNPKNEMKKKDREVVDYVLQLKATRRSESKDITAKRLSVVPGETSNIEYFLNSTLRC